MTEIYNRKTSHVSPTCEIVTIGSELLLGQIIDTNTTYLSRELGKTGVTILFRTAVADNMKEIKSVIQSAAERCDMVITTGGLGPTVDDLTREALAAASGVTLEFREDLMQQISERFRSSGYNMPDNNRRQAFVPEGAQAIPNPVGTAPSFIADVKGKPVICLPGVPRELMYLMTNAVLPWVHERFGLDDHNITYKVLKTSGIGEGAVDDLIGDLMGQGKNPEVGLLASVGEVKIRITADAADQKEAEGLIQPVEQEIRSRLGDRIFGEGEDTLEQVIGKSLVEKKLTLAVLETFTCGMMAQRLYQSQIFPLIESIVIPDQTGVQRILKTDEIKADNKICKALALKVREDTGADIGLALLGFPEENNGRYILNAHIYIAGNGMDRKSSIQMGGDLSMLQQRGSVTALNILRLSLLE